MKENFEFDDEEFAKVYNKIYVPLELIESIKTVEVLEKIKEEMRKWYFDVDVQSIAKDPCVIDAMIDLFIRTVNKYKENEVNKIMRIKDHKQPDIMKSLPDDPCGDWSDSIAHLMEILKQASNDYGCHTCKNENEDIIDQIKKEFIDKYPKNRMGDLYLNGRNCYFSLNQVLNILDKYKGESEDK